MKFKIKIIFKIAALFLCFIIIMPATVSCGAKEEVAETGVVETNDAYAFQDLTATPDKADVNNENEPIDPNLPYYDYLDKEFARFGFSGGTRIVADTEYEVMTSSFRAKNCDRFEIDLSNENVPFEYAYRYEITSLAPNFWEKACESRFRDDKTLAEGDIIAGVVYVRDGGGPNPAQLYFAIKTPSNNWS